jgi:predicted amidophosphoribosyltransferase
LWRGFNQAEHLARTVSARFGGQLNTTVLQRRRFTHAQYRLARRGRRKNIVGAFGVTSVTGVMGKTVLLVDDIMTSGLTLEECAKVLKKAGAKKVWALVWAHG